MLININVAEIIGGVSAISLRMMYLLLMAILIVNFVYSTLLVLSSLSLLACGTNNSDAPDYSKYRESNIMGIF